VLTTNLSDFALMIIILLLTVIVWETNHFIQLKSWNRVDKLSIKLILRFVFSIAAVAALSFATSYFVGNYTSDQTFVGFKQILGFTFRINLFLHCINAIYQYNQALSDSRLEAEQLKKQSTEAKLEALKNQVNPHFLFNSLNILTSIIEEDSKTAVKYVNELSKVYRYLLKNENENLVPLHEEISFIQSYLFLLKLRFSDNLQIDIGLDENKPQSIPPSTLQILIENAIKHNEISNSHTLKIGIFQQNGHIVVENNMKARSDEPTPSGIGLKNIVNRYVLITSEKPIIRDDSRNFVVKLPVIGNQ